MSKRQLKFLKNRIKLDMYIKTNIREIMVECCKIYPIIEDSTAYQSYMVIRSYLYLFVSCNMELNSRFSPEYNPTECNNIKIFRYTT